MKTPEELSSLEQEIHVFHDRGDSFVVSQLETGVIVVESYSFHVGDGKRVELHPWGETIDGQELWKYVDDAVDEDIVHPVATLDYVFIAALF